MFDCVMPTRNGRHGLAFTRFGPVNLKNARHADDPRPLDERSADPATRTYSRAYLHHLVKANETLGAMLLSAVNLAYYQALMRGAREAIAAGDSFAQYRTSRKRRLGAGRHPAALMFLRLNCGAETGLVRPNREEKPMFRTTALAAASCALLMATSDPSARAGAGPGTG